MAHDWAAYSQLLKALLPRGRAWRADDSVRDDLLDGTAVELARVEERMLDLVDEADTRKTVELIGEHETDFGLPDGCLIPSDMTLAQRQVAVLVKKRALGRLNKQYYIDLAATLGYTISITEYQPAWSGIAVSGDPCGDQEVIFYWRVNVHYNFVTPFSDYVALACLIDKLKPVHTIVQFAVYGPGFSAGFSNGFAAMPAPAMEGGFSKGFSLGFDVRWGGGFDSDAFSDGFEKPFLVFGF